MENFSQRICNLTVSRTFSEKTKEKRAPRHLSGVNKITEIMRRKLSFSRRARCGPFPEATPRIPFPNKRDDERQKIVAAKKVDYELPESLLRLFITTHLAFVYVRWEISLFVPEKSVRVNMTC